MNLTIYTDGSYKNIPGSGAWEFYVPFNEYNEFGDEVNATNNIMVMTAIIKAIDYFLRIKYNHTETKNILIIVTDSKYVKNGI